MSKFKTVFNLFISHQPAVVNSANFGTFYMNFNKYHEQEVSEEFSPKVKYTGHCILNDIWEWFH